MMQNRISQQALTTAAVLLTLSIAGNCFADDQSEAKKLFKQAGTLFIQENYYEALHKYQASYDMVPRSSSLRGIGACFQAMGKNVDAVNTYRKVIAMEGAKEADVEKSRSAVRLLEESVGYLGILNAPDGAVVNVDGADVAVVPLDDTIVLNEGSHLLEISMKGYDTLSETISIDPGKLKNFSAVLQRSKGKIAVSCTAGSVTIDGVSRGECPVTVEAAPGTHEVIVEAAGKKTDVQTVDVVAAEIVSLEIALVDLPPPATVQPSTLAPTVPPVSEAPAKRSPGLLIGGVTSLVAGIAGIGVGIGFTVRAQRDYNDVVGLVEKANQAALDRDAAAYNMYVTQYRAAKEAWENDKQPADRAGVVAGYVVGGVLTVTGVILLGINAKKKRSAKVSVVPTVGGLTVSF